MRKLCKGILVFLLMFAFLGSISVSAADDLLGTVVDGSLLTDDSEAVLQMVRDPLTRGTYLSYGQGSLYITGYRNVTVQGATYAYYTCDTMRVSLYLEQLKNGSWVPYATVPTATAYNTSSVSTSKSYSVAGGYYYRVSGGHTAIKNGKAESCVSFTNGIWVD